MNTLREKLALLEHKRKLMTMDKSVSEEKIFEIDELIKEVKKEITRAMFEERKQHGKNR